MFLQVIVNICQDRIRDLIPKKFQCIFSGIGDVIQRIISLGSHIYKTGLIHLGECLLNGEIIGVFFVQNEFGDLRVGQRIFHLFQHFQNDQFI